MKKLLFIPFISLTLLLKFCTSGKEISEVKEPSSTIVQESIKVNRLLNGFNTENMYFHYNGEKEARELIESVNPTVLRFPGGTPANVYHIDGPGYGYEESDLQKMNEGTGPYKNAQKSISRNSNLVRNKSTSANHAEDFSALANSLNAEVLLVANLLGNDEDVLKMIQFFKDREVPLAGIELGNEYYLKAYWKTFPEVEQYIARAKTIAEKIRSQHPDLAIGVVAPFSSEIENGGFGQRQFYSNWNDKLAKEDFYDAVICHIYSKNSDCDNLSGNSRFSCYLEHNKKEVQDLGDGVRAMTESFDNKPLWITEWNIKRVFDGLGNTALQGIYYADVMLKMTDLPAIEIATYHNLLTSSDGYNMIAKDRNSASGKAYIPRSVHPVAELMAPIFKGQYERISIAESGIDQGELSIAGFNNGDSRIYYIVNKSEAELSLAGIGLSIDGDIELTGLTSPSLGSPDWIKTSSDYTRDNLDEVSINPLSIYRIELK